MEKKIIESKIVTFRVNKALWDALEEAKWSLRKAKSEIIKEAVVLYLKDKHPEIYERFLESE